MEINTNDIVQLWKKQLADSVKGEPRKPKLAIIVAKDFSEPSYKYIDNKIKAAKEVGVDTLVVEINWKDICHGMVLHDLYNTVNEFNNDKNIDGIIIQKPFLDFGDKIDNIITPKKDVDGFTDKQKANLINNSQSVLIPATALGVMNIIKSQVQNLEGKRIIIANRTKLIGIPLFHLALHENMTPVLVHTKTDMELKNQLLKTADIVVTGCGQRKIFSSRNFNENAIIIDCSMNKIDGVNGVGDCNKEEILENSPNIKIASGYGHTGKTTCMALIENTIKAYNLNKSYI